MQNPYLEWIDENQVMRRLEVVDRVFIGRTCKGIADTKVLKSKTLARKQLDEWLE